jgi:hypothetical protein
VLVALLVEGATFDADLGLRLDSLTSTIEDVRVSPATRTGLSALGTAAAIVDTSPLRYTATYSPRVWTSDVEAQPKPLLNQALDGTVETQPDGSWRLVLGAGGARGSTGPLVQASGVAAGTAARPVQVPTTDSVTFEEVYGRVGLEVPLGLRTKLTGTAGGQASRTIGADAALAPLQRGVSLSFGLSRLLTERDTLDASVGAGWTVTDVSAGATTRSESATALATWRRRLTPSVEGWLGAGASWLRTGDVPAGARASIEPAGEVGVRTTNDARTATASAVVRATTFVDRFTGVVSPAIDARCDVGWRATDRLSFAVTAAGGARTDGSTTVATATARVGWLLREALSLEAGVMGFEQHETVASRPSFVEAAVFASLVYRRDRIFGNAPPPGVDRASAGLEGDPGKAR